MERRSSAAVLGAVLVLAACGPDDSEGIASGVNNNPVNGFDAGPADATVGIVPEGGSASPADATVNVAPGQDDAGCTNKKLDITVRDFSGAHPDFSPAGPGGGKGMVKPELSADKKPVHS